MKTGNRNIILLGLGFLLLAFGFNGVQQYITSFFANEHFVQVGFNSLIIIYAMFALSSPFASVFAVKFGAKKLIVLSALVYSLFLFSLLFKSGIIVYVASVLLGVAAGLIWCGQGIYLIRASEKGKYGRNAGIFTTLFFLGSAAGIFAIGQVIAEMGYTWSFFLFAFFPLLGLIAFLFMSDYTPKHRAKNKFLLVKRTLRSPSALKLSSIWFSQSFVYGLSLGLIPLTTTNIFGVKYISYLLPLFYIMPILISYIVGKTADREGIGNILYFSYATAGVALLLLFLHTGITLVSGVVLLAMSFASLKVVTLALPGSVAGDKNLEYLTGLFWLIQNIGTLSALLISKMVQASYVYLVAFGILILSLVVLLTMFKGKFSKASFAKIKHDLEEEIVLEKS